jgi:hypothetical protein
MSASVQAQLVKFGFKGGLNYANYSDLQFDALTSYHAGLVAEIKLVDSFSIQPGYCILHKALPIKNAVEEFRNELGYLASRYGKDLFE